MERLKNRKQRRNSFTGMIVTGIIMLGICMMTVSILLLLLLQILGRKGAFSSTLFVRMELLIAIGYVMLMIGFIWFVAFRVAKKMRTKGRILIDVSDKIRNKQLDFEIPLTGVTEIDTVLFSMQQMKEALADSLQAQWKMEQGRQKQLSALVHDLKTPITILEGNLYLLQYENVSAEGKKSIEDMTQCVKEMSHYITQLLEISRDNLQSTLTKEACTLEELTDEVLQAMDVLLKQKKVAVQRKYESEQNAICCDKREIKRAIQNIVSNAVDFSPENTTIRIDIIKKDLYVELSVTDAGKGFSEKDLKMAKEQFYMGDTARGRSSHFGLGLSITENIVKAHGGVLEIANRTDHIGGVVSIELPILE